jgi:hypothetical protein
MKQLLWLKPTSSLLGPNILLRTLFSNTLSHRHAQHILAVVANTWWFRQIMSNGKWDTCQSQGRKSDRICDRVAGERHLGLPKDKTDRGVGRVSESIIHRRRDVPDCGQVREQWRWQSHLCFSEIYKILQNQRRKTRSRARGLEDLRQTAIFVTRLRNQLGRENWRSIRHVVVHTGLHAIMLRKLSVTPLRPSGNYMNHLLWQSVMLHIVFIGFVWFSLYTASTSWSL